MATTASTVTVSELRKSIANHLADMDRERRALEDALKALGGPPPRRGRPRKDTH